MVAASLSANHTSPRRMRRRGVSTITLIASFAALMGLLALVIDMAMVTLTAQQIQAAADAAALAGAANLHDRSELCPVYKSLDLPPGTIGAMDAPELYQSQVARQKAIEFGGFNVANNEFIVLQDNPTNEVDGDVVLGNADATAFDPAFEQWVGSGRFNAVLARIPRTQTRGNPITLWIAKAFGIASLDVTVSAQAAFEQRVYGFQPGGHVPIPMVPYLADPAAWPTPANGCVVGSDRFTVDPTTGAVTGSLTMPEPDSFPEIELRIKHGGAYGNAFPLPVGGAPFDLNALEAPLQMQTLMGVFSGDLAPALGGVLAVDPGLGYVDLPPSPDPTLTFLQNLIPIFNAIRGEERVWPLGTLQVAMGMPTASRINDFAAGRVVHVSIDDNGTMDQTDDSLLIVVQPCLLQTSTCLVRSDVQPNRWLGKLLVIR